MTIEYRNSLPSKEEFVALFDTTGWNMEYNLSPEELIRAISNSWFTVSAYDADTLVGFGRIVSDGVLHAMIYDLITDPSYQNHGIGTEILARLVAKATINGIRDIQLFCARGKRSFYENRHFKVRSDDAPGMEYVAGPV